MFKRHLFCILKACGVRNIDVEDVSLDITGFDGLHLNRLLNLKYVFAFAETYLRIEKEPKNEVRLSR